MCYVLWVAEYANYRAIGKHTRRVGLELPWLESAVQVAENSSFFPNLLFFVLNLKQILDLAVEPSTKKLKMDPTRTGMSIAQRKNKRQRLGYVTKLGEGVFVLSIETRTPEGVMRKTFECLCQQLCMSSMSADCCSAYGKTMRWGCQREILMALYVLFCSGVLSVWHFFPGTEIAAV